MNDYKNLFPYLINEKLEKRLYTGAVPSMDPLQVKLHPADDAINVKCLGSVLGLKSGSNVLMVKFLSQFIIIGVVQDSPYAIGSSNYVKKESGTSRTSTTSSDDPDLTLTLPKNGIYRIESIIFVDGTETGTDFKWKYTQSGLTHISYRAAITLGSSSTSVTNGTMHMHSRDFTQDGYAGVVNAGWTCVLDIIYVSTSSSDGTITLNWGCINSSATITVKNNSVMAWTKIDNN